MSKFGKAVRSAGGSLIDIVMDVADHVGDRRRIGGISAVAS